MRRFPAICSKTPFKPWVIKISTDISYPPQLTLQVLNSLAALRVRLESTRSTIAWARSIHSSTQPKSCKVGQKIKFLLWRISFRNHRNIKKELSMANWASMGKTKKETKSKLWLISVSTITRQLVALAKRWSPIPRQRNTHASIKMI